MFGLGKSARTHRQQALDELTESYGHLRMAAAHAAGGAAERLTPPYDRARNVANRGWTTTKNNFSPLYEQMRQGAAHARKGNDVSNKRHWPVLVGLLAAGAAVGAAGAVVVRRRRVAAEWEEYEPTTAIEDTGYAMDGNARAASAKHGADRVEKDTP